MQGKHWTHCTTFLAQRQIGFKRPSELLQMKGRIPTWPYQKSKQWETAKFRSQELLWWKETSPEDREHAKMKKGSVEGVKTFACLACNWPWHLPWPCWEWLLRTDPEAAGEIHPVRHKPSPQKHRRLRKQGTGVHIVIKRYWLLITIYCVFYFT